MEYARRDLPLSVQKLTEISQDLEKQVEQLRIENFQPLSENERLELLRMVAQKTPWVKVAEHPAMLRLIRHEIQTPVRVENEINQREIFVSGARLSENELRAKKLEAILLPASAHQFTKFEEQQTPSTEDADSIKREEVLDIYSKLRGLNEKNDYNISQIAYTKLDVYNDEQMSDFFDKQYKNKYKRFFLTLMLTVVTSTDISWERQLLKLVYSMYQAGIISLFIKDKDVIFSPQSSVFWHKFAASYFSVTVVEGIMNFDAVNEFKQLGIDFLLQLVFGLVSKTSFMSNIGDLQKWVLKGTSVVFGYFLPGAQNFTFNFQDAKNKFVLLYGLVTGLFTRYKTNVKPWFEKTCSKEVASAVDEFVEAFERIFNSFAFEMFGIQPVSNFVGGVQNLSQLRDRVLPAIDEAELERRFYSFCFKLAWLFNHALFGNWFEMLKDWLDPYFSTGKDLRETQKDFTDRYAKGMSEETKRNYTRMHYGNTDKDGNFTFNSIGENAVTTAFSLNPNTLSEEETSIFERMGLIEKKKNTDGKTVWQKTKSAMNTLTFGSSDLVMNSKNYQKMTTTQFTKEIFIEFKKTYPQISISIFVNACDAVTSIFHLFIAKLPEFFKTRSALLIFSAVILLFSRCLAAYWYYAKTMSGRTLTHAEFDERKKEFEQPVSADEARRVLSKQAEINKEEAEKAHNEKRSWAEWTKGAAISAFNFFIPNHVKTQRHKDPKSVFYANYYNGTKAEFLKSLEEQMEEFSQEHGVFTSEEQQEIMDTAVALYNSEEYPSDKKVFVKEKARMFYQMFKYREDTIIFDTYANTTVKDRALSNIKELGPKSMWTGLQFLAIQSVVCSLLNESVMCSSNFNPRNIDKDKSVRCYGFYLAWPVKSLVYGNGVTLLGCSTQIDTTTAITGQLNNSERVNHVICNVCTSTLLKVQKGGTSFNANNNDIQKFQLETHSVVALQCKQCKQFSKIGEQREKWKQEKLQGENNNFDNLLNPWRVLYCTIRKKEDAELSPSLFSLLTLEPPVAYIPYALQEKYTSEKKNEVFAINNFIEWWILVLKTCGVYPQFKYGDPIDMNNYQLTDRKRYMLVKRTVEIFQTNNQDLKMSYLENELKKEYQQFDMLQKLKPLVERLISIIKQKYGAGLVKTALKQSRKFKIA